MNCTKRQKITKHTKGEIYTFFKCTNCLCDNYRKEVTEDDCSNCPLKQMRRETNCRRQKPCSVKMEQGLLVYGGPCPEGFQETEKGFKNIWPECPQAFTNNTIRRDGVFAPIVFCGEKNKQVTYEECAKCFKQLEKINNEAADKEIKKEEVLEKIRDEQSKELEKKTNELREKLKQENEKVPESFPSLDSQVKNYSKALYKWVTGGMDSRPKEEVERIFDICKSCEFFKDGRCLVCGCRLANKGVAVTNKIKMATEHCPKGKW